MDSCIADSISQRTANLMKTLGRFEILDSDSTQPNDGTYLPQYLQWANNGSKSETATSGSNLPCDMSRGGLSRARSKPGPGAARGNKSMTVKSKSSSGSAMIGSTSNLHPQIGSNNRPRIPPSEGIGGTPNRVSALPNNLPRYETFYNPKSYQPLPMFNLSISKPTASTESSKNFIKTSKPHSEFTFRNGCSMGRLGHDTAANYSGMSPSTSSTSTTYNGGYNSQSYTSNTYPRNQYSTGAEIAQSPQQEEYDHHKNVSTNKTNTVASRCKSAVAQQGKDTVKSKCWKSGRVGVRKSSSENPDHNNNFCRGGSGIFFGNRMRMPGRCDGNDLSGQDRISLLAQPKNYCRCGGQNEKKQSVASQASSGKRSLQMAIPDTMERINYLAQPKLCHYTVCSCCLSPNCLGECTTKFNVNKTSCQDASCVDWDRLAIPRKNNPPPSRVLGAVKSSALKARCSKRTRRLARPVQRKHASLKKKQG